MCMWIRIQIDMDIFGIPDQQANLCGFGKLILIHMFFVGFGFRIQQTIKKDLDPGK